MKPVATIRPEQHSTEAERATIGACWLHPVLIDELSIGPEHFTDPRLQRIWAILVAHRSTGLSLDPVAIVAAYGTAHGTTEGIFALGSQILEETPSAHNAPAYAEILQDRLRRRTTTRIARELLATNDTSAAMSALVELERGDAGRWEHSPNALAAMIPDIVEGAEQPGLPTGFAAWDGLGGLSPGELIVVTARPSMGKTAFVLNVTANAGVPALFVSGEQSARTIVSRMVASEAGIPLARIRSRTLRDRDYAILGDAQQRIRDAGIHVIDRPSPSLIDIERDTRRHVHRYGARIVIVDYLQRMAMPGKIDDITKAVMHNIAGLKTLARQHNLPVILIAQAGRKCDERTGDARCPRMDDLQWASAIEQDADVVVALYREQGYEPNSPDRSALVRILKNRDGPKGEFRLAYHGDIVRFQDPQARNP